MLYDLVILFLLVLCVIRGASKGFAWQVAGIGALVLCFLFATPLSSKVAPSIPLESPLNRWVAMLGIYLAFSFGTFMIARMFREFLEKARFQEFDRHLGALFGFLKGVLIALVGTFFLVGISKSAQDYILKTYTGQYAAIVMDRLHPVMPEELHDILEPYIHKLDAAADGKLIGERDGIKKSPTTKKSGTTNDNGEWVTESDPGRSRTGAGGGYRPISEESRNGQPGNESDPLGNAVKNAGKSLVKEGVGRAGQVVNDIFNSLNKNESARSTKPEKGEEVEEQDTRVKPTPRQDSAQKSFAYRPSQYEPLLQQVSQSIARSRKRDPEDVVYELELAMEGLPKSVAAAILDDLRADLQGSGVDPNPETDYSTAMKDRVLSQINRLGINRRQMTQGMRDRLDAIERD